MKKPDGWKNPYPDARGYIAQREAYGAGTDDVLKLLKAQGLSYENSMSIPRLAGYIYSKVAGKKGHIVFIEEEE